MATINNSSEEKKSTLIHTYTYYRLTIKVINKYRVRTISVSIIYGVTVRKGEKKGGKKFMVVKKSEHNLILMRNRLIGRRSGKNSTLMAQWWWEE